MTCKHPPIVSDKPLLRMKLELVRGCPYTCGACNPPKDWLPMPTEKVYAAVRSFEMARMTQKDAFPMLHLHGWGEPSLRPDLVDVVARIRDMTPALLVLSTNGAVPERIAPLPVDRLVLGLDSFDPAMHRKTRGWSLDNTLRLLSVVDLSHVTLTSLVHRENTADILRISDLFSTSIRHVVRRYDEDLIGGTGNYTGPDVADPSFLTKFWKCLEERGYDVSEIGSSDGEARRGECTVGYDGQVYRCLSHWSTTSPVDVPVYDALTLGMPTGCTRCFCCKPRLAVRPAAREPKPWVGEPVKKTYFDTKELERQ